MKASESKSKHSEQSKREKKRTNGFEEWGGYMAAKKQKLVRQFEQQKPFAVSGQEECMSKLFSGISIYVNGYTKPSAEELKQLMMLHGGRYDYYYHSNTTFMVASNLPDSKVKSLKDQKVIKPEWIVDSIKAGKLLPYLNYLLYSSEFTDKQKRLGLTKVSPESRKPVQVQNAWKPSYDGQKQSSILQSSVTHSETVVSKGMSTGDVSDCSKSPQKRPSRETFLSPQKGETSPSKNEEKGHRAAMKAGHPDFISEFYSRSRLHHISTAGQELKQYIQRLAAERKGKPFTGRQKMKTSIQEGFCSGGGFLGTKTIMHIDMDCFFVSVGLKKFPELRGKPVAVAHSKGKRAKTRDLENIEEENEELAGESSTIYKRSSDYGSMSEIASCSYEARRMGIRNGMYLGEALKLCPGLKTIPYDFEEYSKVSKQLYDIVASYTLDIEAVSCDELFVDCTELLSNLNVSPLAFASLLRKEIFDATGCCASAGMGRNMLLARLATRVAKPNGQFLLKEDEELDFMKKQQVRDLPGVGYSSTHKLHELGIYTCGDLQMWSLGKLQQEFGTKTGQCLYDRCRGRDERSVSLEKDRKSVSAEINYGIRFEKEKDIYDFLNELATEVQNRLKNIDKKGRSITLKLKVRRQDAPKQTAKFLGHGICDSISKSVILRSATDDWRSIANECCTMARLLKIAPEDYRGVGIQVTKLEPSGGDHKGRTMEHFLSKQGNSTRSEHRTASSSNMSSEVVGKSSTLSTREVEESRTVLQKDSSMAFCADIQEELDQSVLNALPEELKQEVLSAYSSKQRTASAASHVSTAPAAISKRRQNVAVGGKRSKSAKPASTLECYTRKSELLSSGSSSVVGSGSLNAEESSSGRAELSGVTHIDEVRELVKEWVSSSEAPADEDIEHFKDYLFKLIQENLEKMDFVLRYFYRIVSSANILWKEAYLLILSYVQQKMLQDYGYMLKAESKFEEG